MVNVEVFIIGEASGITVTNFILLALDWRRERAYQRRVKALVQHGNDTAAEIVAMWERYNQPR